MQLPVPEKFEQAGTCMKSPKFASGTVTIVCVYPWSVLLYGSSYAATVYTRALQGLRVQFPSLAPQLPFGKQCCVTTPEKLGSGQAAVDVCVHRV